MLKLLTLFFVLLVSIAAFSDEDEHTDELLKQREARAKQAEAMQKTMEAVHPTTNIFGGVGDGTEAAPAPVLDEKTIAELQKALAGGLYSSKTPDEVKAGLLEQVKGSKLEKVFKNFPKVLNIAVDILRDKDALPGMLRMMGRKQDLKKFYIAAICIFIFGFLLRRFWLKPRLVESGMLNRFMIMFLVNIFFAGLTWVIFFTTFKGDVRSTVQIVTRNLFNSKARI